MSFLTLCFGLALMSAAPPAPALTEDEELRFIEEVLFRQKYISNGSAVMRWNRQPTLSIMSADTREAAAVAFALEELDRPLRPVGYRIRAVDDGNTDADILIYHLTFANIGEILARHDLPRAFARLDMAHPVKGDDGAIEKVFIFMDARLAADDTEMQRRALKLLLAAMGLGGETRLPIRSIFFEVPPSGLAEERPRRLSVLDIRAIRLLYAYLAPGDDPESVTPAFRRHWRRLL